jgi:mannosyltransferase OCH1-like enzyme
MTRERLHKFLLLVPQILYKRLHPHPKSIRKIYTPRTRLGNRIPNVVYQTWKVPILPALHAIGVRRFRELNPEYSFEFFDDSRMASYMDQNYGDQPIGEVFRKLTVPAAKADVWRYCILYREGGVYCDIDSALRTPLRDLLADDPSEMLSFEGATVQASAVWDEFAGPLGFRHRPSNGTVARLQHPENTILNWLLCFEPQHPVLRLVIDRVVAQAPFFRGKEFASMWKAVIHATGPLVLTQAVWDWMDLEPRRPSQAGIDFRGQGIFKLAGSGDRYTTSPHYFTMKNRRLFR